MSRATKHFKAGRLPSGARGCDPQRTAGTGRLECDSREVLKRERCGSQIRAPGGWVALRLGVALLMAAVFLDASGPANASAQVFTFNSSAGYAGQGAANGAGTAAQLYRPAGVAMDGAGNLYVADSGNNVIRKITSSGQVSTLAGIPGMAGSADGAGAGALFNQPVGIAVDGAGNLYVTDSGDDTIRKVTPSGVVTTLAGLAGVIGSANGTGTNALFNQPQGIAVDSLTNLYVADYGNHTIRMVSPSLAVTTLAGSAGVIGSTNGAGANALFYQPQGVAVDGSFNVYVADTANGIIRKISQSSAVTTLAGSPGSLGAADGTGTNAQFYQPEGIAIDHGGNLYVADYFNNSIRKITPAGVVTTLAGLAGTSGSADGVANQARFRGPLGLAVDGQTNLFVADCFNGTIRELSPAGVVTTLAGSASAGSADGPVAVARFNLPMRAAVDSGGNLYVADSVNSTIRKITPAGQVSTFAGSPGNFGSVDGTGTNAWFNGPQAVAVDGANNVYVADTLNDTIRKITPQGVVSTYAGLPGVPNNVDGTGTNAQFFHPQGIALDTLNNVYVADTLNNTIRRISPGGVVATLAGLAGYPGSMDGTNGAARFNGPQGLAVSGGNIYVADTFNHVIREVSSTGSATTLAGLAGVWGAADGTNNSARFFDPAAVAVDSSGRVYVADAGNQTVRLLTPSGTNWVVTTVAGLPGYAGSANGSGTAARFDLPGGIVVDPSNLVYVADSGNNSVRLQAVLAAQIPMTGLGVVQHPASAIVSWTTPVPATSQVAFGSSVDYGNLTAFDANLVTNHAVLLTGLVTNITTYFEAISTAPGAAGATNDSFFTDMPGQDLPVNGQPPDWWLNFYYGTTNLSGSSTGANGLSLLADYVAGLPPNDAGTALNFGLNPVAGGFQVWFSPWVNGRIYQLESATNLAAPLRNVESNLVFTLDGDVATTLCTNLSGAQTFYRLSVQLAP